MPHDRYPLIHIGYHKTGTTWLQKHLFTSSLIGFTSPVGIRDLMTHLVMPHALDFDASACRAFFEPRLRAAQEAGLMSVVSRERFSGDVFIGGEDSKELADRLCAVFPNGRVLIVIREQCKVLLSVYGEYVKDTVIWSLSDFLRPPIPRSNPWRYAVFRLEHFRYDRLIRYYMELFGASNVLVLPYEQLRANPKEFVEAIVRFSGLDGKEALIAALPYGDRINTSLSGVSLAIKRRLNWIIGEPTPATPVVLFPLPGSSKVVMNLVSRLDTLLPSAVKAASNQRLATQVATTVGNYYASSNRRTAELTGLDLAAYGYMIEDSQ